MAKKINEEDLENVGGGAIGIHDIMEELTCPYCGSVTLALFSGKTRFSPGSTKASCGKCSGYIEGKCNADIVYDLKKCCFYFEKED